MAVLVPTLVRITLRPLILPLTLFALFLVLWGIVSIVRNIVEAILGVIAHALRHVPLIGNLAESAVEGAERSITNALKKAGRPLEKRMAGYWHQLAKLVEWVGDEILRGASLIATIATLVAGLATIEALRHEIARLRRQVGAVHGTTQVITKTVTKVLPAKVTTVTRVVGARTAALAGELGHVIEWDIPRLRARDRELARQIGAAAKWIRAHGRTIGETAAVGAVAVALSRLGASWVRCRNWNRYGRAMCATDSALADALAAELLLILGVVSVVEFAQAMRLVEDEAVAIMGRLVREWPS